MIGDGIVAVISMQSVLVALLVGVLLTACVVAAIRAVQR